MLKKMLRNILMTVTICFSMGEYLKADSLSAYVQVSQPDSATWSYTLYNSEVTTSPNFIDEFDLAVDAPISYVAAPSGWDFVTDFATYVDWFSGDDSLPYPDDIPPGGSLGGFGLNAPGATGSLLAITVSSWDQTLDQPGLVFDGNISSPTTAPTTGPSTSPEGGTFLMALLFIIPMAIRCTLRRVTNSQV